MEQLMEKIEDIKKRVDYGSSICPAKQYPFMMFKCGFLFNRVKDINKVISFMEIVQYLKAENKLIQTLEGHLLNFLYQRPEFYVRVQEILNNMIKNKSVNVLIELQKLQQQAEKQSLQKPNNCYQNNLTKTGTMLMQPQQPNNNNHTYTNDNDSQKTQKYDDDYFKNVQKMNLQSEALAKKLQEEEEMLAKNVGHVADDTVCEVCYVGLYDQEFLPLEACQHIFHKNCLAEYFKAEISENRFPLKCPSDKCGAEVKDSDIKQILQSQLYKKYEKHTLKHYADMHGDSISWCPTANCQYMFFYQKDDQVRFECLQCKKQYCLNCRVQWHKQMSCKQFQISNTTSADDQAFMRFVKGKKFKQCPKCKFWVEKNQGCDHMTCKCKFQFCYKCGGVYMKCQCVAKMQADMERRREQINQRRRRKLELMEKRRNNRKQPPPPPPSAPERSRRRKK